MNSSTQRNRLNDFRTYRNRIDMGDRLFARLTRNGVTVVEIMSDRIGSMTDLVSEVRRNSDSRRGLVKLYVRNHSKGWSSEKPLMLYGPADRPVPSKVLYRNGEFSFKTPFDCTSSTFSDNSGRMLAPWECH